MTKHALFLQHRTKPGERENVQKIWQKHMQPAITENPDHEIYVYSFGDDPDRILRVSGLWQRRGCERLSKIAKLPRLRAGGCAVARRAADRRSPPTAMDQERSSIVTRITS